MLPDDLKIQQEIDEIASLENSIITYINNAKMRYNRKDYRAALSFLEIAENEIKILQELYASQQNVHSTGGKAPASE